MKQKSPENDAAISDRGAVPKQEDALSSAAATSTGYYGASGGGVPMFDSSTFLAEILGAVREQWRLIAACLLAGLIIGLLHGFLAEPTFETNALVQVEPKIREIGGPFSDFENSRRINDALVDEVEVL